MPNTNKVTISVSPSGHLSYDKDPVEAKKLDGVWWECEYTFSIILKGDTPFIGRTFNSIAHNGKHSVEKQVVTDIKPDEERCYPYTANVDYPKTKGKYKTLTSHSPDIIIKRNG